MYTQTKQSGGTDGLYTQTKQSGGTDGLYTQTKQAGGTVVYTWLAFNVPTLLLGSAVLERPEGDIVYH